ncbi:hypothetical protein BDW62DRAFT_22377 [Aspergillus aurantiobrunneus]
MIGACPGIPSQSEGQGETSLSSVSPILGVGGNRHMFAARRRLSLVEQHMPYNCCLSPQYGLPNGEEMRLFDSPPRFDGEYDCMLVLSCQQHMTRAISPSWSRRTGSMAAVGSIGRLWRESEGCYRPAAAGIKRLLPALDPGRPNQTEFPHDSTLSTPSLLFSPLGLSDGCGHQLVSCFLVRCSLSSLPVMRL